MKKFLFSFVAYGVGMTRYEGEEVASGEDQEEATNRVIRKLYSSAGSGVSIRITGAKELGDGQL